MYIYIYICLYIYICICLEYQQFVVFYFSMGCKPLTIPWMHARAMTMILGKQARPQSKDQSPFYLENIQHNMVAISWMGCIGIVIFHSTPIW